MPEPSAVPLSQPPEDGTPAADRPGRPAWWRWGRALWEYRDTWYFGGGGLLFLFTEPDRRGKGVGVLLELFAAFAFLFVWQQNRKRAGTSTPKPEPYANLQAAMARLHETEDKAAISSSPRRDPRR
jgi:GNAT superfamily N-acetyltransferase